MRLDTVPTITSSLRGTNCPSSPYSVDEIYGLKNTNRATTKYPVYTRTYTSTYRIYGDELYDGDRPEEVIVEDSNAGYEFFKVPVRQK